MERSFKYGSEQINASPKDLSQADGAHAIASVSQRSIVRFLAPLGMTNYLVRASAAGGVEQEPSACEFGDFFQRARLFKEMRRVGNDLQLHFTAHPIARLLV
jgi:hypothetical protein